MTSWLGGLALPGSSFQILKRFWTGFLRYHRLALLASILCMAVAALMTAASARLVKDVFDGIFVQRDQGKLVSLAVIVLGIFFVKGLAAYGHSYLLTALGQRVGATLQRALFRHIVHADHALFTRYASGKLLSMMTYDTQVVFRGLTQTLVSIVRDALTLVLLVGVMFYQDWFLACITCIGFPLSSLFVVHLGGHMRRLASAAQNTMGGLHAFFQEIFQGVLLVKSYTLEDNAKEKARHKTEEFVTISLKNARMKALLHPLMEVMGGCAVALVLLYGGYQVLLGVRTPGDLMSFVTAFVMSYEPLKKLAHLSSYVQEAMAALERIYGVFNVQRKIVDQEGAKDIEVKKGNVVFESVAFGYHEGQPLFEDLSLTIAGGKRVAIVGPSGAGKSTLFYLLLRFYDAEKGRIFLDGQDTQTVTLSSLRRSLAYVAQETTLFDDTVETNIRYGRLGATDAEVVEAAKHAYAHDFIMELPQGYQTQVGEMGRSLSGGQRQRVAIARAFLKNAPLLLLDEATSALDATSELYVQKALEDLMKGRTTLIIAHRLLTAQQADKVYVLEDGRLVAEGTHEGLLETNDAYKRLILPQLQVMSAGLPKKRQANKP